MVTMHRHARSRSTSELLKELGDEMRTLVRAEIRLAKAEMAERGRSFGMGAALLAVAATMGGFAFAALTAAAVLALAIVMPAWTAAIVVAVVYGAIAALLAIAGKSRVRRGMPPVPEETKVRIKEDVEWAKTRLRSARRSRRPGARWARRSTSSPGTST